MKEDLTRYTDAELSLRVFNDESLYCLRRYPHALHEAISNLFIFTNAQRDQLRDDITDDYQNGD